MRNLESRKGSIIASETISASWSIGKPKDHARRHQPRTFVTLYVSWAPWQRIGPSRAMKLYLDSRPPRPGESRTGLQKRRNTMDDYDKPTSETPYGQSEGGAATAARKKLSETAAEVKEKVAEFGRKTVDNIDESRKGTAGALGQAAAKLHSGGEQISGVAHATADKLEAAADYIRETDLKGIGEDLKDIVKRYPGPALAAAAVLGFLVARGLRRD